MDININKQNITYILIAVIIVCSVLYMVMLYNKTEKFTKSNTHDSQKGVLNATGQLDHDEPVTNYPQPDGSLDSAYPIDDVEKEMIHGEDISTSDVYNVLPHGFPNTARPQNLVGIIDA